MAPKAIVSLVLGCALLGGYASIFTSYRYGYFDALRVCTSNSSVLSEGPCVLDMSDSVSRSITGFATVDEPINVLLEFFSQGLRSDPGVKGLDIEALLAFVYLAAQFGGAWYIIALEGMRVGNRGMILSWTGTFGIIFQAVTITIIAPLYLTLQLLGSSTPPDPSALLVDPTDLALLPLSSTLTYLLPTLALCLPLLNIISGENKLLAIALWQPFPLYHTAIRGLSNMLRGLQRSDSSKANPIRLQKCKEAFGRANMVISSLTVTVHLVVIGTILASATTDLVSEISGQHILALSSLTNPPTTAMLHPPVSIADSREIVVSFLRWDVYCTCASMLIWSSYQLHIMRDSPTLPSIISRALIYGILGGPIFPSLMFVWERDELAIRTLEYSDRSQKKGKTWHANGQKSSIGKGKR